MSGELTELSCLFVEETSSWSCHMWQNLCVYLLIYVCVCVCITKNILQPKKADKFFILVLPAQSPEKGLSTHILKAQLQSQTALAFICIKYRNSLNYIGPYNFQKSFMLGFYIRHNSFTPTGLPLSLASPHGYT